MSGGPVRKLVIDKDLFSRDGSRKGSHKTGSCLIGAGSSGANMGSADVNPGHWDAPSHNESEICGMDGYGTYGGNDDPI